MKILLICGASRSIVWFRKELIQFLKKKGNQISVVACDPLYEEIISTYGVQFFCVPGDNRDTGVISNLRYWSQLTKTIKKIAPEAVMTFQVKANTFGVFAAARAHAHPIVSMVEGVGDVYHRIGIRNAFIKSMVNTLYRLSFKKVNKVLFLNEEDQHRFLKLKLLTPPQCIHINGIGIDTKSFRVKPQPSFDTVKFVMVARVTKDKGIYEYAEAAKRIYEMGIRTAEFNYYGDCDFESNILLTYAPWVTYKGSTTDVQKIYEENHVVVLPSYHEGFPRSLLEASAKGRALIASDIAGCNACVLDGVNGRLVRPKSVDDLVEKMLFFINNRQEIEMMGHQSRRLAVKMFDSGLINAQIYETVLSAL